MKKHQGDALNKTYDVFGYLVQFLFLWLFNLAGSREDSKMFSQFPPTFWCSTGYDIIFSSGCLHAQSLESQDANHECPSTALSVTARTQDVEILQWWIIDRRDTLRNMEARCLRWFTCSTRSRRACAFFSRNGCRQPLTRFISCQYPSEQ